MIQKPTNKSDRSGLFIFGMSLSYRSSLILLLFLLGSAIAQTGIPPSDTTLAVEVDGRRGDITLLIAFDPSPYDCPETGQAQLMFVPDKGESVDVLHKLFAGPAQVRTSWTSVTYNRGGHRGKFPKRFIQFGGLHRDAKDTLRFMAMVKVEIGDVGLMRRVTYSSKQIILDPYKPPPPSVASAQIQVDTSENAPAVHQVRDHYPAPMPMGVVLVDWKIHKGDSITVVGNLKDIHSQFFRSDSGYVYCIHNGRLDEYPTTYVKNERMMVVQLIVAGGDPGTYLFLFGFRNREGTPCIFPFEKKKGKFSFSFLLPWFLWLIITIYALMVVKHHRRRPQIEFLIHNLKFYNDNRMMPITVTATVNRADFSRVRWFLRDEKLRDQLRVYRWVPAVTSYEQMEHHEFTDAFHHKPALNWLTSFQFKSEVIQCDLLVQLSPAASEPKILMNLELEWKSEYGTGHHDEHITLYYYDSDDPKPSSIGSGVKGEIPKFE